LKYITPGHLSKIIIDALHQYETLLEAGALIDIADRREVGAGGFSAFQGRWDCR